MTTDRPYHHGDLRQALLAAAVEAIDENGPAGVSLRDLARRAGVSHAAPVHHFGNKAGLLTALAAEGFELLAADLAAVRAGGIVELGVTYVRFATKHRAHFEVMFRPDLYDADNPDLAQAGSRAYSALAEGIGDGDAADPSAMLAAWSLVHGFATLWNTGVIPPELVSDPDSGARTIAEAFARMR
ncbi:TetR/AcrR family transcriptional regulator [Nocardia panacis]|uniref:TetR/AcrR family transcriptional regulator n=1 Tax=Nocardia panacis TaxID=2340916 RepID=A0A3A4L6F2_9NOCA|nr:TetR/AcrR family transcriptional regulator [Nocardia panacis]RJO78346.1 TetR/AcrR family transcriptional regulator [Nocardia panacis]